MQTITINTTPMYPQSGGQAELIINVWSPGFNSPDGKVEIFTTRGRSVILIGPEWFEFASKIALALGGQSAATQVSGKKSKVK